PAAARILFSWLIPSAFGRARRPLFRCSSCELLINNGFKNRQSVAPVNALAITPLQKCPQAITRRFAPDALSSGAPDLSLGWNQFARAGRWWCRGKAMLVIFDRGLAP